MASPFFRLMYQMKPAATIKNAQSIEQSTANNENKGRLNFHFRRPFFVRQQIFTHKLTFNLYGFNYDVKFFDFITLGVSHNGYRFSPASAAASAASAAGEPASGEAAAAAGEPSAGGRRT